MGKISGWIGRWLVVALLAGSSAAFAATTAPLACDANGDGVIDTLDLDIIFAARNTLSSGLGDPRDVNADGKINVTDWRICSQRCTRPGCSTVNLPPIARAGADQTVPVGTVVTLDGTTSTDPEGSPLTYKWTLKTKPAGSATALQNATSSKPTLAIDAAGNYTITLVVNDGQVDSAGDDVVVSTSNSPPVANPGSAATYFVGETAVLDGSGSTDVDGDPLTFAWTLLSQPAASHSTLALSTSVHPTLLIDAPGDYVVQLVVNDGKVDSAAKTVTLSTKNSPPVANPGPNRAAAVNDIVQLDGSGSTDVDGDPLTYTWSLIQKPIGSTSTLSSPNIVNPTFRVDLAGNYVVQLVVNDGKVNSTPVTATISTSNQPPIARPGPAQSVPLNATVQLDGSASSDPEGSPLTYSWALTAKPVGSAATPVPANAVNPTFVADKAGSYLAQLIVNDGQVSSAPATVTISTINSRPIANAGPTQTVNAGATVHLDGSASSDPDGTPLNFSWSFTQVPPGASPSFIPSNAVAKPDFVATLPGTYIVQLIVDDGLLFSVPVTVTITVNANLSTVGVVASLPNASEIGPVNGEFTFSRSGGDLTIPLTVNFTVGGTATNGVDYMPIGTSIAFAANETTKTLALVPLLDSLTEGTETVIVTLSSNAAYTVGANASATVNIADAAAATPTVSVSASAANASEAGPVNGQFTFTRSGGDLTAPLSISFTIGGSASPGTDYALIASPVVIPANQTTVTVPVTVLKDNLVEGFETVVATIAPNAAYTIGTAVATVTIADDPAVVSIVATTPNASETGPANGVFTLTRSGGDVTSVLIVNYTITGTATNGVDYTTLGTSAVFAAGQATTTVTVVPIPDALVEGDETVILTLVSGASYTVAPPVAATVTISDTPAPAVTVTATTPNASEVGPVNGVFTFTRSGGNLAAPLTVNYAITGTATNGVDYTTLGTSVAFAANQATATVTVVPIPDALAEGDETVILTLQPNAGAYVVGTPATATVTIADATAVVSVVATTPNASEVGPVNGVFTFSRAGGNPAAALTISFAIGGTASNGGDYAPIVSQVTIPANQASATVTIVPTLDALVEGDETVILTIQPNANYTIGAQSSATVTIADAPAPVVTVVATTPNASEVGPVNGVFTFTRSAGGNPAAPLTISFGIGGTASNGGDYTAIVAQVTIPANQTSATVNIVPILDAQVEGDETVILTVNPTPASYVVGAPASATVTIADAPAPVVTVVATTPNASETGPVNGVFTFTRSAGGNPATPLTIAFAIGGTASNGADYTSISAQVTIPANQTSATVTIVPIADGLVEGNETVILTIQPTPASYAIGAQNSATVTIADAVVGPDLAVSSTVDNATPTIGQNVTLTVTINNPGPGSATGVVVQDTLPAGYTNPQITAFNGSYDAPTGVWTVGTLTAGQTATLRFIATVQPTGPYNNTATRTASSPSDPNAANDTATAVVTPFTTADVAIATTIDNPTPTIGTSVTITTTATNIGPGVAQGVVVQDLLPAGYTGASITAFNGSYNAATGVWTVGNITVGQVATLRFIATVAATGPYNNTATRTASSPTDTNVANDTATVVVAPIQGADVAIATTIDNATPTIGTTVQINATATNNGPGVASGVVVQDLLPAGYTITSVTAFVGSYNATTGVWTVGNLSVGQVATLRFFATVGPTGPYNNTATRTASTPADTNAANDTATVVVTPITTADVAIATTIDNPTPTIGTSVQINTTATNNGPGVAQGVVVQDLLPAGYTAVSVTAFVGSYNAATGVWTVGNLNVGQVATLRFFATVAPTGPYNNTATRTASAPTDPNAANDTATVVVTPITTADVAIATTIDNPTPTIGTTVQINATATNNGPGVASGVVVQDLLPAGYTAVSVTAFVGSYNAATGVWTVGNLNVGQVATLRFFATVAPTGPYNNTATRTASTPTDPNAANDTATVVVTPFTTADVQIGGSVNIPNPNVGQSVTISVTATNAGPGVAQNVVVQDSFPAGYTNVSITAFNGSYDAVTGVWSIGNLNVGQVATLRFIANVAPTGPYNNTATRTSSFPTDPVGSNDTFTVVVTPPLAAISVAAPLVPLGGSAQGVITLPSAAGGGGVTVSLSSGNTAVLTVPASVLVPAGQTQANFTITAVAAGTTTITASASGFSNGGTNATVTANVITIANVTIGPSTSGSTPVTLSAPAPAGGLVVTLSSSNPSVLAISPATVTIPAGTSVANPNPIVTSGANLGQVVLSASAAGYASGFGTGTVALSTALTPNPLASTAGRSDTMTVTLGAPAPAGGILVNLASSNPALATVPASVTVPQGNLTVSFTVSSLAQGTVTITASGPQISSSTATVNIAPAPGITYNFPNTNQGKDSQENSFSITLQAPAPAGGVNVTLTSSDPTKLLVAPNSATAPGAATLVVNVPGGSNSASWAIQALSDTGTATITVSAPGYTSVIGSHNLVPSGFYFQSPSFATTTLSTNTNLQVCFARLSPGTLTNLGGITMRPGATPVSIALTATDLTGGPNVGAIVGSPSTISPGASCTPSGALQFDPAVAGTSSIALVQPAGYATPANLSQSLVATVTAAGITYNFPNTSQGKDSQENSFSVTLQAPAPAGGVNVTLVSNNPNLLLAPNSATTLGSTTLVVNVPAGQTSASWAIQALADTGSATVTVTAPGFTGTSGSHNLVPSGFYFQTPSFATTTLSANTSLQVCFARLSPGTLTNLGGITMRPGATPASIVLTATDLTGGPNVGAIVGSPSTITPGTSCTPGGVLQFDPANAGTSTIALVQPAGYATPANLQQSIVATVTAAGITYNFPNTSQGKDSQENSFSVSLQAPAPAGGVNVTLVSNNANLLLAPNGATTLGSTTLVVNVPAGQSSASWSIQALADTGSATVTVTAPGYTGTSGSHNLVPSGFYFQTASFPTTTLSANTSLQVCFARLSPGTLTNLGGITMRPGATPVSIALTATDLTGGPNVGAIVGSPSTITPGTSCTPGGALQFDPLSVGTSKLALVQPATYATPADLPQSIVATVTATGITYTFPNYNMGFNSQENGFSIVLQAPAPAGGVNVTLTSSDPTRLLLAANGSTALGSSSLVVNVPQGQNSATYSIQGLADNGTVQVSVSAPGYVGTSGNHRLVPSGFYISNGSFVTTQAAANTALSVCLAKLDPVSLANAGGVPLRPGAPATAIAVASSNANAGVIVGSPAPIAPNASCTTGLAFDPNAPGGVSTISITQPVGHAIPSNLTQQISATVN